MTFNNTTEPELVCQPILDTRNIICVTIFTVIFCLSIIGNSLVVVTVIGNRHMRTATNVFLLNLSIADLLLSIFCLPPTVSAMIFRCFFFGQVICKAFLYFQPITVCASAHTLVVIAVERYYAICRPLHSRRWQTKRHCIKMVVCVWLAALIISSPFAILANIDMLKPGQYNCKLDWPSDLPDLELVYTNLLVLAIFVGPLAIMSCYYVSTCMQLWAGMQLESQGSNTSSASIVVTLPEATNNGTTTVLHSNGEGGGVSRRIRQSIISIVQPHKKSTASENTIITVTSPCRRERPVFRLRSTHGEKNLIAKRRVIKMLAVIVLEFFVFWTPFYAFILAKTYKPEAVFSMGKENFNTVLAALLMLSYLSACSNPITYCFMNNKFRQAFLVAFGCKQYDLNATKSFSRLSTVRHNSKRYSTRKKSVDLANDAAARSCDDTTDTPMQDSANHGQQLDTAAIKVQFSAQ